MAESVRGREKTLAPTFCPGARAAGAHREQRADDVLGIETELGPESAPNVRSDEPQLVEWKPDASAEQSGMGVRQLARRVVGQPSRSDVEIRQHDSTLERCGGDTAVGETPADNDVGLGERATCISAAPVKSEGHIVRHRIVQEGRALLDGCLLVGDGRQLVVSNSDPGQRVVRRVRRFGGHRRDRLPGVPNPISRQDRMQRHHIHARSHPLAGQVANIHDLVGREHVHHALQRTGVGGVDGDNPGVGMWRTQHLDTQSPGGRDQVRDVAAAPSQEPLVFEAW
jgi:hypothetical protein